MATQEKLQKSLEALKNLAKSNHHPSEVPKKKEKIQYCYFITEAISNPTIRIPNNYHTLLGSCIEIFLLLCDDQDADIRMTSEECLNRIIRAADGHIGKIQIELHKEIKKNGAARSLRAALWLFSVLAHHIRPHKGKPYAVNVFQNLVKISERTEESIHETLAAALPRIMKVLGCFTTENEMKVLLKAFLNNVTNESAVMRRTNTSCILTICEHCKKPNVFTMYCFNYLLDLLIPVHNELPTSLILGVMSCIKGSLPNISNSNNEWNEKSKDNLIEKLLQIFELCVFFLDHRDHNIINVCLETLNVLLMSSVDLKQILLNEKGISRNRIFSLTSSVNNRSPSQLSLTTSLTTEDNLFSESELTETIHSDIEKWIDESKLSVMNITFGKTKEKSQSLEKLHTISSEVEENLDTSDYGKMNELNKEHFFSTLKTHSIENTLDILSSSDNSSETSTVDDKILNLEEEMLDIDIGNILEEKPLIHCIRKISKLFLLSGTPGTYISDKTTRVSVKFLALSCLTTMFKLYPSGIFIHLDKNFVCPQITSKRISSQKISDIFLFKNHSDPQLRGALRTLVGIFSESVSRLCQGNYDHWISTNGSIEQAKMMQTEEIITIFIEGLNDDSSTCIRQTLISLDTSLKYLIEFQSNSKMMSLLNVLPVLSQNPYWLVKCALCDLVSKIDFISLQSVMKNCQFQDRVLWNVLFALLDENDQRVRMSTATAIVEIIPRLYYEEYFMNENTTTSKAILETSGLTKCLMDTEIETCINKKHFVQQMPFPLDRISGRPCDRIEFSLSKILTRIQNLLLTTTSKHLMSGCIETLSLLSKKYPCTVYKKGWGTSITPNCGDTKIPDLLKFSLGLLTSTVHVYGLQTHIDILNLTTNLYAGHALSQLKPLSASETDLPAWSMFGNSPLRDVSESLLNHSIKMLSIFHHVLNDLVPAHPQAKAVLPSLPAPSALSPLKRRKSDLDKKAIGGLKMDAREERGDKREVKSSLGCFVQAPHYMRIYEMLKAAFSNYKMSLDSDSSGKFLELLTTTLHSLSVLMEVGSMMEFERIAEDILGYFRSTFVIEAAATVECVQQLLKCLFSTNLTANVNEFTTKNVTEEEWEGGFYYNVFQKPYNLISKQTEALNNIGRHDFDDDSTVMGYLHRKDVKPRPVVLSRSSDKVLANYIRIFEPMVIKSLKQYTISSDVKLQCQVLQLLCQLVQLRVNYCLLDSEQVFIGFVLKQFEFIEEGQIMSAEQLIRKIFQFLVQLSYSKHHSKCIIEVPKIINLCDGLMASGQPSSTHCIPALEPIVEDVFLTRNKSNTSDVKELETTREVVLAMLLRLCDNRQVLDLVTLILEDSKYCTDNTEKWLEWSKRVFGVVLPLLKQNKLQLDHPDALSSMRRFVLALNPEVFKPFDAIIIMFFQEPPSLEGELKTFNNWLSKILIILLIVTPLREELLLSKINKLKSEFSPGSIFENVTTKADPLNVNNNADTFQKIPAELVFIRFLFRVVSVTSKMCLEVVRHEKETFIFDQSFGFLMHCLYIFQAGNHCRLTNAAVSVINKNIPFDENNVIQLDDINHNFVSLAAFHPILTSGWCNLLTILNFNSKQFWSTVLKDDDSRHSINMKIMRVGGAISFCDYLSEHMADLENLIWFLKNCSSFLVELSAEPPVSEFISSIHRNSSTSKIFLESVSTNVNTHKSAVYKVKLLKCIENCHSSQIGLVLNLLIPDFLKFHQAVVSRMAATLASRKIEMLLTMPMEDVNGQLTKENLNRILHSLVTLNLVKKHETLVSLLNKLSVQYYDLTPIEFEQRRVVNPEYIKKLKINKKWYLSQIETKYSDPTIAKETAQLLDKLEYSEILSCMSSSAFNKSCLRNCLRLGLTNVRKQAKSDLVRASTECLVKDIASLVAKMPCPHQVIYPIGRQESPAETIYKHELISLFENQNYSELLCNIAICIPAFLNCLEGASNELSQNNYEELMMFGVACLEYLTYLSVTCDGDVKVHLVDALLTASDLIARNAHVAGLLGSEGHVTKLCSGANNLFRLIDSQLKDDRPLPTIPLYALSDSLANEDSLAAGQAANQLYTLSCWLFELRGVNSTSIPDFLFAKMKSLTVCLCRSPLVNSYVLVPNRGWKTGWLPETVSGWFKTVVPSLPIELLKEIDILEEYIFRINLLGWTSRQQFEETWMCLLSVLCVPLDDLDVLDFNDLVHASSLAIKAITALLLETLSCPIPGNPNVSDLRHISRNFPISVEDLGVSKLKNIQDSIQLSYSSSDVNVHSNVTNVFKNRNFEKISDTFTYGQVSIQYFMIATGDFKEYEENFAVSEICQKRRKMLKDSGLDINSCLQFLIDYYTQLMKPQSNTHIRVLHEAVRSTVMISDLFMDKSQFSWMMEVFLELSKLHLVEDEFLHQFLIVGICKAVAVLTPDLEIYEQVKKMLMQFLKSPYLTSRFACLYGALYVLEGSKLSNIKIGTISEEMQLILPCMIEYVQLNLNTTNSVLKKSQEHSNLVWSLAFYLIENIEEIHMEQNFVANTLNTAFSSLKENSNTYLHNRLTKNLERLFITKKSIMMEHFSKPFLKLALEKMRSDNPVTALLGTQLLITYMYTDCANHLQNPQNSANTPTSPDHLVQTIEKISAIFERIKRGYTSEVEILCAVLPDILNDFFSSADILTKVIGEFLSAQQPHPKLLSKVVFQVFESAIHQNQLALLQDWVVFSLPNFTQSFSIGMATWCLTCFFVSASTNSWLRAYFSYVQTRVGRYEYEDRKMLCIAGADFYGNLANDSQRRMFVDNFEKVKDQPDTPFNDLLLSL
ncbi:unnamed protein product [Phaedon cochleariae]|uniref:Huntingtin n=1 Tax=Phaedon cochleariae TaxID=80249 RepID=A0A9P0DNN8_PHACE|nr:unnamed protein product [Phaedon cochleariae]